MARLPVGTTILRRYVLTGAIGHGGVSTVYSAVDAHRGRPRAVKVLAPMLADDPYARDEVRREALITDSLRHPSVPRVFAYGDAALPDGTVLPFVVLELLTGVSLAERLAAGRLAWPVAVRIAATVADVLAVAHRRGVVHRDLTARNIMVTGAGVKIIDFGLATAARSAARPTAETGGRQTGGRQAGDRQAVLPGAETAGRPTVLRRGAGRLRLPPHPKTTSAQPADDVYTLGVLLYEMVTGRSPYPRTTAATIVSAGRVARLAPTPVLAVAGLPREVGEIVRACMAKVAAARPASAQVALALWAVHDRAVVRSASSCA